MLPLFVCCHGCLTWISCLVHLLRLSQHRCKQFLLYLVQCYDTMKFGNLLPMLQRYLLCTSSNQKYCLENVGSKFLCKLYCPIVILGLIRCKHGLKVNSKVWFQVIFSDDYLLVYAWFRMSNSTFTSGMIYISVDWEWTLSMNWRTLLLCKLSERNILVIRIISADSFRLDFFDT
jgi:hypothetical protein